MVETTKMDKHIFEFQFWVQVEWTRVLGLIVEVFTKKINLFG